IAVTNISDPMYFISNHGTVMISNCTTGRIGNMIQPPAVVVDTAGGAQIVGVLHLGGLASAATSGGDGCAVVALPGSGHLSQVVVLPGDLVADVAPAGSVLVAGDFLDASEVVVAAADGA